MNPYLTAHKKTLATKSVCFLALWFGLSCSAQELEYVIEATPLPRTTTVSEVVPLGLFNTSGALGGEQFLSLSGLSARHSLILWEGISLSDPLAPGGLADVSTLGSSTSARLTARPYGSRFGSRASGGVLELSLGEHGSGVSASIEAGSEQSLAEKLSVSGQSTAGRYHLSVSREDSRGISAADSRMGATEPDAYSKTELAAVLKHKLGRVNVAVVARVAMRETDFDGFDTVTFAAVDSTVNHASSAHSVVGLKASLPGVVGVSFGSGYSRYGSRGDFAMERFAAEHRLRVESQHGVLGDFLLGAELAQVAGEPEQGVFTGFGKVIGEADLSLGLRLENSAGSFGPLFDSELGLKVAERTRVFASLGSIARRATLYERLGEFGNPSLRPESGFSARLGVRSEGRAVASEVALFASRLTETIEFRGLTYQNGGESAPRGLEARAETYAPWGGRLTGSYQYVFSLRPEHRAALTWSGEGRRLAPDFTLRVVSARVDRATGVELTPYGVVGGGVRLQVSRIAKARLRVENLLNQSYQETFGYGTRGTTVWLGLEVES